MREFGKNLNAKCRTAPVLALFVAFFALLFSAYTGATDTVAAPGISHQLTAAAHFAGKPCHHRHKSASQDASHQGKARSHHSHSNFTAGADGFHSAGDLCCEDENAPASQQTALRLPRDLAIASASADDPASDGLFKSGVAITPFDLFSRTAPPTDGTSVSQGQIAGNISAAGSQFTRTIRLLV